MEWIRTPNSETMSKFGYDSKSHSLFIIFRSNGLYRYFDVAERVFSAMKKAESKGRFFADHIRGIYRYIKT